MGNEGTERAAELAQQITVLQKELDALNAVSGKVKSFIDEFKAQYPEGPPPQVLARIIKTWEIFKQTGTL